MSSEHCADGHSRLAGAAQENTGFFHGSASVTHADGRALYQENNGSYWEKELNGKRLEDTLRKTTANSPDVRIRVIEVDTVQGIAESINRTTHTQKEKDSFVHSECGVYMPRALVWHPGARPSARRRLSSSVHTWR
jgi:hypothetical protein